MFSSASSMKSVSLSSTVVDEVDGRRLHIAHAILKSLQKLPHQERLIAQMDTLISSLVKVEESKDPLLSDIVESSLASQPKESIELSHLCQPKESKDSPTVRTIFHYPPSMAPHHQQTVIAFHIQRSCSHWNISYAAAIWDKEHAKVKKWTKQMIKQTCGIAQNRLKKCPVEFSIPFMDLKGLAVKEVRISLLRIIEAAIPVLGYTGIRLSEHVCQ